MNPLIDIWTKPRATIDHFKDSNWASGPGFLFYFLFAINVGAGSKLASMFDTKLAQIGIIVLLAVIGGAIFRVVWMNLIFYFGKIWKGQATRQNIDNVIALSMIPEIIKTMNLLLRLVLEDSFQPVEVSYALTVICFIVSIRILIIGLSRVQKFGYGISVLNIIVPQLLIIVIFYSIRGV